MRRTYRRKKYKPDKNLFNANLRIRSKEVNVIDEEGKDLGTMDTRKAVELAQEKNLDLVEVNPKADPPICRIMNYGQFQYKKEKEKRAQKSKLKKIETKGVRLSFRISEHDRDVRIKQALKFFEKGHKVKFEMTMRGREHAYTKNAVEMMKQFVADLQAQTEDELIIENPPKKEGGRITALVATKKK